MRLVLHKSGILIICLKEIRTYCQSLTLFSLHRLYICDLMRLVLHRLFWRAKTDYQHTSTQKELRGD